jgi:hypothetical protein
VVRFTPPSQPVWTANFEPGMGTITAVLSHPNLSDVVVLAKGAGYVVTPHREYQGIGVAINAYWQLHGPERLLLDHQGTEFELLDQHGIRWRTRRFSWDGIANVVVSADRATGLAYSPTAEADEWLPFEVNLETGAVVGGSFPAPE